MVRFISHTFDSDDVVSPVRWITFKRHPLSKTKEGLKSDGLSHCTDFESEKEESSSFLA